MTRLIVITGPEEEWEEKKFSITNGDTIGNSASDSIYLHSDKILAGHVKIAIENEKINITTCSPEIFVDVNGERLHNCRLGHGDLIAIEDYVLMVDEDVAPKENDSSPVDETIHSRIEMRQKHYDSTRHIIDSLGDGDQSQKRLVTLYKISSAISGILDLDLLLKRFLEIILEEFSADRGFIMLAEKANKKLVPAAIISRTESETPKISKKIVEEVFSTKESILCENILDDTRFKSQKSLLHSNILSAMCVPLIRKRETLGLIHVDSRKRNKFSQKDLDLLTKISMQAAIVIENARFYKVRQDFNRNLLALSQATQTLSSYLRQDLIIRDAAQYASQIFQAKRSYLFFRKENDLTLAHAVGVDREKWPQISVPATLKEAADNYRPLLYNDAENIPQDMKALVGPGSSIIAAPLSVSEQAIPDQPSIGILCITEKEDEGEFTIEDQQLLAILASYTATGLSNAKFYQQLKNKEEEIARWNLELEKRVAKRSAELKSTQDQLIQSEKMAAIGLLAAGVAHEFNNIIASMYGFAQIAKKNPKYREKLVDTVISQSKRGCDITEHLLSFSKQRGDRPELVDVRELVESVLRLTMSALENEGIQVVKQFENVPKILLNPGKIQQVFLNIIINARHAIERNGTITIDAREKNDEVYISFQDTGQGIEEENLKRIFEPFYTTKGSFGGGTQPGTGIGLSLCYNIVRQHNGNIRVESKVGEGTAFTVILPITTQAQPESMGDTSRFVAKAVFGRRILVVEDTEDIRAVLANVLQEKKFEVYVAENGSDAVEMCKKESFDVIFLDIRMPGAVDGFDVFEKVKKLEPNTRIIIITGRAEDATLMQYIGRADGYLRKPFDIEDIYNLLGVAS